MSRIIFTVANDPQSSDVENHGGGDFRAVHHSVGLYYGFEKYQDEAAFHKALYQLSEMVREERQPIVVLGGGAERETLLFSTIETARFLIRSTEVKSVIAFTVNGVNNDEKSERDWVFDVQVYRISAYGLAVIKTFVQIKTNEVYPGIIKLVRTLA